MLDTGIRSSTQIFRSKFNFQDRNGDVSDLGVVSWGAYERRRKRRLVARSVIDAIRLAMLDSPPHVTLDEGTGANAARFVTLGSCVDRLPERSSRKPRARL